MKTLNISFDSSSERKKKNVPLRPGSPVQCTVSLKMRKSTIVETEVTIGEHFERESLLWLHHFSQEKFSLKLVQKDSESADEPEKVPITGANNSMESKLKLFNRLEKELKASGRI